MIPPRTLALAPLLGAAAPAWSGTFVVNALIDLSDASPGDGACKADLVTPRIQCTLRMISSWCR